MYEQKPTEIDEFHKTEEKKVKERVEKTKNKRREVAEGNKFLKKNKKQVENKEKRKRIAKKAQ